jgi:hypothetical protein
MFRVNGDAVHLPHLGKVFLEREKSDDPAFDFGDKGWEASRVLRVLEQGLLDSEPSGQRSQHPFALGFNSCNRALNVHPVRPDQS